MLLTSPLAGQLNPPATSEIGKYIVVKTKESAQFWISLWPIGDCQKSVSSSQRNKQLAALSPN